MNRTLLLTLASLVAVTLSGCTGAPAGTPALGDTVTVDWTAFDAHSGDEVASGQDLQFVLGSGGSGLGRDFERHLIGLPMDQAFSFVSESDPSRPFGQVIATPRDQIDPMDATADVDVATFTQAIGMDPVVGDSFEFNVFKADVVGVADDVVTYRHVDHAAELATLGVVVISHVMDGMLHIDLQALEGAQFTVQEPSPFNPGSPLEGLVPGDYRTRGMTETHVLFDHTSNPIAADLERPLRFTVTVTAVQPAPAQEFSEDGFTARASPVLLADPAAVLLVQGGGAPEASHDDGHDGHSHDGHSH